MDHLQPSWQQAESGAEARIRFVRSVYAWLMGGFGVALLGALVCVPVANALVALVGNFFMWALIIAQFGAIFFASAVAHRKPLNIIAYGLFTFISGTIAGIFSLVVAKSAGPATVGAAFGLTALTFLTLTITAFVTKKDFSYLRSFVVIGIAIMFFGSLIAAIFKLSALSLVASGVAVIACSAKILMDTSAMLRTGDFSNPAGFALSLFVSLYNIFISLLNILGRRR